MITLNDSKLDGFVENMRKSYESQKSSPLFFAKWLEKAYPVIQQEYRPKTYPYTIKIAPSTEQMLQAINEHTVEFEELKKKYKGDELVEHKTELLKKILVPEKELVVKEPFTVDGTEVWFGDSMEGIPLRLGYLNGDSRFPKSLYLGDDCVHAKIGGATGAGKSVLLNQIICSALLELPPWELQMTLCDFKFVEMVRYCNTVPTPHVSNVVACDDIDYVLSLIQDRVREMNLRQELFSFCDVTNLKKFRKKFNLTMPQQLLLVDEVQQLFLKNPKKNPLIENEIQAITKLGRSMGVHMIFASQSMKGTISKDNLANFKLGVALFCEEDVSTTLLGNDEAKTIIGKGKCFANTGSGKKEDNLSFRVPFIEENCIVDYLVKLNENYAKVNEVAITEKYDEKLIRKRPQFIKDFDNYILKDIFLLGDSVKFKRGDDRFSEFLYLDAHLDTENLMCVSLDPNQRYYLYNLFRLNADRIYPGSASLIIHGLPDPSPLTVRELSEPYLVDGSKKTEYLEQSFSIVEKRKLLYERDSMLDDIGSIQQFYLGEKKAIADLPDSDEMKSYRQSIYDDRMGYTMSRPLKLTDFKPINVFVYDAQSIVGLGRTPNNRFLSKFKDILFDSTVYNVRYFIFTSMVREINELLMGCNHRIIGSSIDEKDRGKLNYYDNISSDLYAYMNRKDLDNVLKFKRFDLELDNIVKERKVRKR